MKCIDKVKKGVEGCHGDVGEGQVNNEVVGYGPHASVSEDNPDDCDISSDGHQDDQGVGYSPQSHLREEERRGEERRGEERRGEERRGGERRGWRGEERRGEERRGEERREERRGEERRGEERRGEERRGEEDRKGQQDNQN